MQKSPHVVIETVGSNSTAEQGEMKPNSIRAKTRQDQDQIDSGDANGRESHKTKDKGLVMAEAQDERFVKARYIVLVRGQKAMLTRGYVAFLASSICRQRPPNERISSNWKCRTGARRSAPRHRCRTAGTAGSRATRTAAVRHRRCTNHAPHNAFSNHSNWQSEQSGNTSALTQALQPTARGTHTGTLRGSGHTINKTHPCTWRETNATAWSKWRGA